MTSARTNLPASLRALAGVGGLLLLSACAQGATEGPSPQPAAEAPAYEYRGPTVETSPLLYEPGSIGRASDGTGSPSAQAAEQCHTYARAIVAQDRRTTHDRDARRSGQLGSSRTFELSRSMQQFGERGTYDRFFTRCMESRGFGPGT